MKHSLSWMAALACAASLLAQTSATGWQTLFNGQDASAWRSYKGKDFPAKGWKVEDGTLHVLAKGGGGDLVTREQFQDFELSFDWKVAPGANSGVMYRVSEKPGAPYETGPEYQVLDDAQHGDGKNPKTSASALYALVAANTAKKTKPVGEWNEGRILVRGSRVEHWLNGSQVVAVDLQSPEIQNLIANSKFKAWPGFARQASGHICLQDHGDDVWYRNIKIRRL